MLNPVCAYWITRPIDGDLPGRDWEGASVRGMDRAVLRVTTQQTTAAFATAASRVERHRSGAKPPPVSYATYGGEYARIATGAGISGPCGALAKSGSNRGGTRAVINRDLLDGAQRQGQQKRDH
jgi:hypothetical protein